MAWGNKAVDENKLWELGKSDVKKFEEISSQVLSCVLTAAIHLRPFLPETSQKIQDIISAEKIVKAEPLFPKII